MRASLITALRGMATTAFTIDVLERRAFSFTFCSRRRDVARRGLYIGR